MWAWMTRAAEKGPLEIVVGFWGGSTNSDRGKAGHAVATVA